MTIFEAYNDTKKKLEAAGITDYVFEAKQIIKHITGLSSTGILANYNRNLTEFQKNNLIALVHQREVRYPLQYIFGEWDFYGRSFYVGPGVLVPRADTETLIDKALEFLKEKENPEILDLCAGSGCIGITLAKEIPDSSVKMIEKFDEAINYAKKNIERLEANNAEILKGDIFDGAGCDKEYDLIISNPPYIPKEEMKEISPETEYEPKTALLAEDNGLEFYKEIVSRYTKALKSGGMMAFEVGYKQSGSVREILENAGYKNIEIKKDFNEIQRVVSGIKER